MQIFQIYDSKADAYHKPFFARTKAEALRMFERAVNTEETEFHTFAADFTLFYCGEWDERTGIITPSKAHESLGCALEFLKLTAEADVPQPTQQLSIL